MRISKPLPRSEYHISLNLTNFTQISLSIQKIQRDPLGSWALVPSSKIRTRETFENFPNSYLVLHIELSLPSKFMLISYLMKSRMASVLEDWALIPPSKYGIRGIFINFSNSCLCSTSYCLFLPNFVSISFSR